MTLPHAFFTMIGDYFLGLVAGFLNDFLDPYFSPIIKFKLIVIFPELNNNAYSVTQIANLMMKRKIDIYLFIYSKI